VLVEVWFNLRIGPAVDAKRFVVGADNNPLGPEGKVLQEDAWAWVLLPMEGYVGVAVTFHFFLSVWLRLAECHPTRPSMFEATSQ
jgi:hypothetical protein